MQTVIHSSTVLGRALRDVRRRQGLTQQQLARRTGLTQPTLSNLERGASQVTLDTLLRILASLKLELLLQPRRSPGRTAPWRAEP